MRWVVNAIAVLMLLALAGGLMMHRRAGAQDVSRIQRTTDGLRAIERAVRYRSVSKADGLNSAGWPNTVDPAWFELDDTVKESPLNVLLSADHPWLEIAPPEQALLEHPPVRLAIDHSYAGYWYNPANGVVRARVPILVSDEESTDLYNHINGTNLAAIFEPENVDQRLADAIKERLEAHESDSDGDLDPTVSQTESVSRRP